jgi:type VI protein secretion system component VasK
MPVLLIILALTWAAFVAAAVIGSADSGGASIVVADRVVATPGTPEGVWILCALAVSAGVLLAWAFGAWNRRRHRARLSAEFDERWALRDHEATAEEARGRLLESRERELDEIIRTLTTQRDALLEEIAVLRANAPSDVVVDVTDDLVDVNEVDRAG